MATATLVNRSKKEVYIGIKNDLYRTHNPILNLLGENNWGAILEGSLIQIIQINLNWVDKIFANRVRLIHAKGVAIKDFSDAISLKTGIESTWSSFEETLVNEG